MTVTDSETKFVDKAGLDHAIDELKKLIEDSQSGDVDLSDYVTQEQLQAALDSLDINIDLSAYATKAELQQAIASIDLSGYATTAYVDNAIANIPSGGNVDLSNYYTKAETYNKEEVNNLIPTVTNGQDGQDGFSPIATVSKSGNTATITITDKNGTTTASISDGQDGTGGGGSSGGGGEVYSTEETAIGTWIDGRTIYREVMEMDLPAMTTYSPDSGQVYIWDSPCNKELLNCRVVIYSGLSSASDTYPIYILNAMSYLGTEVWSTKTTVANVTKTLDRGKIGIYPMGNPKSNKYRVFYGANYASKKAAFILDYVKSITE
ncbi:MAG: hypothetical protein OSJ72_11655 [Lachnospiraceae bacterium]|nr:hypothetical protein [Lachnospiraceae bacterium]